MRVVDKAEWQSFGEWIEDLRKRAGLRNTELAKRAGVSTQWLQELRKGGRTVHREWRLPNPKDEALANLARALGVPVDEMLARVGRTPTRLGNREELGGSDADAEARIREVEERVE